MRCLCDIIIGPFIIIFFLPPTLPPLMFATVIPIPDASIPDSDIVTAAPTFAVLVTNVVTIPVVAVRVVTIPVVVQAYLLLMR